MHFTQNCELIFYLRTNGCAVTIIMYTDPIYIWHTKKEKCHSFWIKVANKIVKGKI